MNNPLQILKAIKNPKQFAMNMIKKNGNPIFNNLVDMANNGKEEEIKQFARNFFKEKNLDFDTEYKEFMNLFKK